MLSFGTLFFEFVVNALSKKSFVGDSFVGSFFFEVLLKGWTSLDVVSKKSLSSPVTFVLELLNPIGLRGGLVDFGCETPSESNENSFFRKSFTTECSEG